MLFLADTGRNVAATSEFDPMFQTFSDTVSPIASQDQTWISFEHTSHPIKKFPKHHRVSSVLSESLAGDITDQRPPQLTLASLFLLHVWSFLDPGGLAVGSNWEPVEGEIVTLQLSN